MIKVIQKSSRSHPKVIQKWMVQVWGLFSKLFSNENVLKIVLKKGVFSVPLKKIKKGTKKGQKRDKKETKK